MRSVIIAVFLVLGGCEASEGETKYKVTCENGFSTGWALYAKESNNKKKVYWRESKQHVMSIYVKPKQKTEYEQGKVDCKVEKQIKCTRTRK